ncbi:hypothetical protein LR010_00910 [Candidatus Gracilibacteria bacterium]|nr:hypothetical protein [Candidatus Gracilibacteria bacterium]
MKTALNMNLVKKIILFSLLGGCFFMSSTSAFLGEDLGLDLYKQIDEGFESLEIKQYEYELTGQGETDINQVLEPIFADNGLDCDIASSADIDRMLADGNVGMIVERCVGEGEPIPTALIEEVTNTLNYIKNTFKGRAETKSKKTYEVARIGLYSDGNIENSPFDLITDLQEIDRVIFSEELEYNGVEKDKSADEELDDFLEEDKDYLYEDEEEEDEAEDEEVLEEGNEDEEETTTETIIDELDYHTYVCEPGDDLSGLDEVIVDDIIDDIEGTGGYIPNPTYWTYPGGVVTNGTSWGGPFPGGSSLTGEYTPVTDSWECDSFFCIVIEFQKSNYGLAGGETMTIETVLKRAAKHLEKPANASLTQRKQTTNNFELGSIIKNLGSMFRGFGIEVSSKPVPILDLEAKNDNLVEGDLFEIENLLKKYYKNAGLDYDRRNDLHNFTSRSEEERVIETAGGMRIPYSEDKLNELEKFQTALRENNRIVSLAVDKTILQDDMKEFGKQFTELERFVAAIEDFCKGITGITDEMKEIRSQGA